MFKAMILLKRKPQLSFKEFSDWWLQRHAPLARRLPHLRRAVFNLVDDHGEGLYDGISELWFDTQSDFEQAYASELGQQVANDSLAHVSGRERIFVGEHVILDPSQE